MGATLDHNNSLLALMAFFSMPEVQHSGNALVSIKSTKLLYVQLS